MRRMVVPIVIVLLLMSLFQAPSTVQASPSITTNDEIGIIKVVDINSSNISEVPDTWFLGKQLLPQDPVYNVSLEYNNTEKSVYWVSGPPPYYGRCYLGGLMASMNTTYYFKLKIFTDDNNRNFDIRAGGLFWVRVYDWGLNIKIMQFYYNETGALNNHFFVFDPGDDDIFELFIHYNADTGNTTVSNGIENLSMRYTNTDRCVHPFLSPTVINMYCEGLDAGAIFKVHFYNFEQRMVRKYITPLGSPQNWQPFGIDGPHSVYTMEGMQYLVDNGFNATVWWDPGYWGALNETNLIFYRDLLNNKTFEMGLHTSGTLTTIPLNEALEMLDNEISYATENISKPLSYSALQGAHNNTHTNYCWNTYGIFDRKNPGSVNVINNVGNIQNNTWPWWELAIGNKTVHATFTHELDKEPAMVYSIDRSKYITWVDTIRDYGGLIVPQGYWRGVANQNNYSSVMDISLSATGYNFKLTSNISWPIYVDVYDVFDLGSSGSVILDQDGYYTDYEYSDSTHSFRILINNNTSYSIVKTVASSFKYKLNRVPGFIQSVSLEKPTNWDYSRVHVQDLTTGLTVSWSRGSIDFIVIAGHSYRISLTPLGGGGGGTPAAVDFEVYETIGGLHFVPRISISQIPLNYTWIFGDGQMSSSKTPTHWYRHAGNYTVTLKVTFERGGERQISREVSVGPHSTLLVLFHSVELTEEGLFLWIGDDTIVWPEVGLFIGGIALLANAWMSGREAGRLRRRGFPDRMKGWRSVQYVGGAAMIIMVLWIEFAIKAGMVV